MAESKLERLEILRDEVKHLTHSPLYSHRHENDYLPVFGEGSPDARLMLIGTTPGKQDAQQGRPLAGASGRILDSLLESVNLCRRDIYITHIVKDYTPTGNPTPEIVELYAPFLEKQIDIIQPHVLAALGRLAEDFLLKHFGQAVTDQPAHVETTYGLVPVIPLLHPAVALYNRHEMANLLSAFRHIAERLK